MARRFRYFEKKRGNRRTGSPALATFGEAAFYGVFLVGGLLGLGVLFFSVLMPQWRTNHDFVRNTCTVLDKRLGTKPSDDGTLYRPEVQIRYQVAGKDHVIWTYDIWSFDASGGYSSGKEENEAILDQFRVGQRYVCWHDPSRPGRAVLIRNARWWLWLLFLLPIAFVLIGGGRLGYALLSLGKSAERRSALVQKAKQLELFETNGNGRSRFPGVPLAAGITDSPGTTLSFRLPCTSSTSWRLLSTGLACLGWNAVVAGFVVVAVRGFLGGRPDWFLTLFVVPFLAIGIGLLIYLLRQMLVATGVGPTLLEISDHPLHPGRCYRLFLSQTGRLKLSRLEVFLVCDEEATFRHGTDTRKESRRVFERPLLRREDCRRARGEPFQADCEVVLPENVMHSFQSGHNEVSWKLLVKGNVSGWRNYERSFPVIVCPAHHGNGEK